jgi:hypothetical protein
MALPNREIVARICIVAYDRAINLRNTTSPPFNDCTWDTGTSAGSVLPTMTLSGVCLQSAVGSARLYSFGRKNALNRMLRTQTASGMFASHALQTKKCTIVVHIFVE